MFKIAFQLLNPLLFSKRARFCLQFTKILCPSHNKAWSYTNTRTVVIVGRWVAYPQNYWRESFKHISKSIRNKENPTKVLSGRNCKPKTPLNQVECDSAIGLHLLQNPDCAAFYHNRQVSILAKAKTQFHLAMLEAIFI